MRSEQGKAFEIVLKQCTKVVKNKVEGATDFAMIESNVDVVAFLQKTKDVAFGASEKLRSHLATASRVFNSTREDTTARWRRPGGLL